MDAKIDERDRISDLPDFILHRILSFLPRKDANQTCVLSKRWGFIWDTFPIFVFDQYAYLQNHRGWIPENMEKSREFMNFVDKSLQKFARHQLSIELLRLYLHWIDHSYVSMVDQCVALALDCGVREMALSGHIYGGDGNHISYVIPETAFAANSISGSFKLARLQILTLQSVQISETVVQNIVHHCPNLNNLHLENLSGLKTLEISKLDKLEKVRIKSSGSLQDLQRVNIDAPNLKHLVFCSQQRSGCSINLTSCHDLKELCLKNCPITDDLLHSFLSRFPRLEVLEIANCLSLRKVKISAKRLRSLQLFFRRNQIGMIQIDAPILSSFEYITYDMPTLFSGNIPCLMKIDYDIVYNEVLHSSWFSKLREFVGCASQRKFLTLNVRECQVNFDLEELGEEAVSPMVEIDHLKLTSFCGGTSVDYAPLIDGLLWSCHPKMLSIPSHSIFQKDCIKVLCEKLLERKHSSCCDYARVKCWHHHLKNAKVENFRGIVDEPLLLTNLWIATSSPGEIEEVHFKLEWGF